jgi:hypothetical protein
MYTWQCGLVHANSTTVPLTTNDSCAAYVAAALWCAMTVGAVASASTRLHAPAFTSRYFGSSIFTDFSVAADAGSGVFPAGYLLTLNT